MILTLFNTKYFYSVKRDIQNHVSIGDYKSFHPLSLFLTRLLNHFDISAQDYIDRVYFEDITPFSPKLIELMKTGKSSPNSKKNTSSNKFCYYLFPIVSLVNNDITQLTKKSRKLNYFINDPTIKIFGSETFSYNGKKYGVKKYYPKFNQPCYQNSQNVFASSLEDKKLLEDYSQFQKDDNRFLKTDLKVAANGNLEKIKIRTIYFNSVLNLPIRFKIALMKKPKNYLLKVQLDSYGWGKDPKQLFTFKNMDIEVKGSSKVKLKLPIITTSSWISEGYGVILEKFSWSRQFDLPSDFEFSQDELLFNISAEAKFMDKKRICCESFSFPVAVSLS